MYIFLLAHLFPLPRANVTPLNSLHDRRVAASSAMDRRRGMAFALIARGLKRATAKSIAANLCGRAHAVVIDFEINFAGLWPASGKTRRAALRHSCGFRRRHSSARGRGEGEGWRVGELQLRGELRQMGRFLKSVFIILLTLRRYHRGGVIADARRARSLGALFCLLFSSSMKSRWKRKRLIDD